MAFVSVTPSSMVLHTAASTLAVSADSASATAASTRPPSPTRSKLIYIRVDDTKDETTHGAEHAQHISACWLGMGHSYIM